LKLLNIPIEKTNVFGGALSLCHPIGMSGTRIIQTLLTALRRQNGKYGIASIANGSGGASAILL
jgi:acetyl-CoA C-acetyltransferase